MPVPRLPPETIEHHFPGSGKGNYPVIETDGECLIFRRVSIGEKKFDVRIWRWDASKALIRLNKDSGFLRETLVEVQKLAVQLFKDNFQNRTDVIMWYDDSNPGPPVCKRELKSMANGAEGKYKDMLPEHPQVNQTMAEIHHLFFHSVTTSVSTDPDQLQFPREVRKDPIPSVDETETDEPVEKAKKKNASDIPENIRIHLPPPFIQPPESTGATPAGTESVTSAGAEHVATIQEELDSTSNKFAGAEFLRGITHSQLAEYARIKTGDNPKLPKAYDVYRTVLVTPNASGADNNAMRDWLRTHYITAYKRFHNNLKTVFDDDMNKQGRNFEQWCQYYAARAVAGFLLVDKQPAEPLYDLLMATPIPLEVTVSVTPKKKSGWGFWPFS